MEPSFYPTNIISMAQGLWLFTVTLASGEHMVLLLSKASGHLTVPFMDNG